MKLSIFAVSALVLSTSFAAVGWADEHDPGAGGDAVAGTAVEFGGGSDFADGGNISSQAVFPNVDDTAADGRPGSHFFAGPADETCPDISVCEDY
jgi:hypothetical protein